MLGSRRNLRAQVNTILDGARSQLTQQNVEDASVLIEAGEYKEALDLIVTQLYELDARISDNLYQSIRSAGAQMKIPGDTWSYLEEMVTR